MQNKSARIVETVKKCCICKADISAKKSSAKTCSNRCKLKLFHSSHKKKVGKCLFCGAKFQYLSLKKKYCNPKCQNAHYRILHAQKTPTILQKFDLLKKIGLIAGIKPPKGNRTTHNISGMKIQLHATDCGGQIAKSPEQICKDLELDEIIFLCKCLGVNPYKFCHKIEIIRELLACENYSIIETCISEIWQTHQSPATSPEKFTENENKTTPILTFEEGVIAYQFWECSEKKKLVETIDRYRAFSRP